jgi:hypothetical protein
MNDMRANPDDNPDAFRSRIDHCFSSQDAYDATISKHRAAFDTFTSSLEQSLRKFIAVDELKIQNKNQVIRPRKKVTSRTETARTPKSNEGMDPVYSGYYGWNDAFFYAWIWSDMLHSHNLHCHDCQVVDD